MFALTKTFSRIAAPAALAITLAGGASAATFSFVGTFDGQECDAYNGFERCEYDGSPTIAKFEFDDGIADGFEVNDDEFPSITGTDEFTINFDAGSDNSGTWSYNPVAPDPEVITAFVVKAGSGPSGGGWAVYAWDETSGTDYSLITWDTSKLGDKALSHITFFDTGALAPIPLPAGGVLLLTALGGLAVARRRKG